MLQSGSADISGNRLWRALLFKSFYYTPWVKLNMISFVELILKMRASPQKTYEQHSWRSHYCRQICGSEFWQLAFLKKYCGLDANKLP